MNLRDQILTADDLPLHELFVPEWGFSVWVATLTTKDRERFEKWVVADKVDLCRERVTILTTCDQDGTRLFTEADIPAISLKNAKACDRIFELAMTVNKLRKDEIDELKKSSGITLSGDLSSNSHSRLESTSAR